METDKNIRTCGHCGKKYMVENHGDCYPGCKEKEEIVCPHCKEIDGYMTTSGWPYVIKLGA